MLENLTKLKNDMQAKKWTICSFVFTYKGVEYIVLVKRFVGKEVRESQYALVKLHFMKASNLSDELIVEANSKGLLIDAKTLREYFGIEWSDNLGDILNQFTERLGRSIPVEVPATVSDIQKKAMVNSLSKSDSEDPSKIYCIGTRRNPDGQKRSEFNADKTKLLRESLFNELSNDETISFCYSADQTKGKSDSEILRSIN